MHSYIVRIYRFEVSSGKEAQFAGIVESADSRSRWPFDSLEQLGRILSQPQADENVLIEPQQPLST